MDRDRLKEVHTSDLTESKLNEDFVDWLKKKGPSWLLVILIAVVAYMSMVRFREGKVAHRNEAWQALIDLQGDALPGSYEDIADTYKKTDGIGLIARMQAADRLLAAIQIKRPVGALNNPSTPGVAPEVLSPEERDNYLGRAIALYNSILDETSESTDAESGMTLFAIGACTGQAAIAEAQGDAALATSWYKKAAERAGDRYPLLADRSKQRIESLEQAIQVRGFPTVVTPDPGPQLTPATVDPAIQELIDSTPDSWNSAVAQDGGDSPSR